MLKLRITKSCDSQKESVDSTLKISVKNSNYQAKLTFFH